MIRGLGRPSLSLSPMQIGRRWLTSVEGTQTDLISDWGMKRKGFWGRIASPFFGMAPLFDVTDPTFRRVCFCLFLLFHSFIDFFFFFFFF